MTDAVPPRRTTRAGSKRQASVDIEKDPSTSKRLALSNEFSNHVSQTKINRQLLTAQSQVTELQNKLNEREVVIQRLEADRRLLARKEEEEREARENEATEFAEERERYEAELSAMRQKLSTLSDAHADLQDEHSTLSNSSQRTIASLKSELTAQTSECALLYTQLEEAQNLAATRLESVSELEMVIEDLQAQKADTSDISTTSLVNSDKNGPNTQENWDVIRDELHRQASYLRQLEATNSRLTNELERLRVRADGAEVLREEKLDLERKVRGLEALRRKVGELEGELEVEREKAKSRVESTAPTSPNKETPISITKELSALRTSHALLLDEHGSLRAQLLTRDAAVSDLEAEKEQLEKEKLVLETKVREVEAKVSRREKEGRLLEREVGFMKALVASYKAEEASTSFSGDLSEAQPPPKAQVLLEQRIAHLEDLLEGYKAANAELEKEVRAAPKREGQAMSVGIEEARKRAEEVERERDELQTALSTQSTTLEALLAKNDTLEQTLFELRGEIAGGRHVPPGVRVLSLKENPAQEWADTREAVLEGLRGENAALLRRLKELEEWACGGGSGATAPDAAAADGDDKQESGSGPGPRPSGSVVPRESYDTLSSENATLLQTLRDKEKRLLRLQQVFTAKSAEFREAIASILGLKLAFYPNGQVRVTSQFDLNASFVFQPAKGVKGGGASQSQGGEGEGEGMTMQLIGLGEGGPQEIPQLMNYWVERRQCIPGFIASVTLECYEKAKMEQEIAVT